jgi:anti-sigma B factor antagonist
MGASTVRGFEKLSTRAGYVIVALRGEFDVSTTDGLRALAAPAASGSPIIVDLAEVAFMDCFSLRGLVAFRARARRAGGDLVLAGPQPIVLRLLFLTDMISHCQVFASVREAVSSGGGGPPVPLCAIVRLDAHRPPPPLADNV